MSMLYGSYALWKCASCGLLNYNTKSSRCQSCFKTKRVNIQLGGELEIWYKLLDQCLEILMEYIYETTNLIPCIHMIIAFPFYQSKIYSRFISKMVNNISLQNLPDYRIDFNSTTYGYKSFNTIFDVDGFKDYDNIMIKKCLLYINNWRSDQNEALNQLNDQLTDDLNQKDVVYSEENEEENDGDNEEIYDFFNIDGLEYESVFEVEGSNNDNSDELEQQSKQLRKLLLVALFKDDKQPINDLKCYGIRSLIEEEYNMLKVSSIIVIKNENMRNVFVYRAINRIKKVQKKIVSRKPKRKSKPKLASKPKTMSSNMQKSETKSVVSTKPASDHMYTIPFDASVDVPSAPKPAEEKETTDQVDTGCDSCIVL